MNQACFNLSKAPFHWPLNRAYNAKGFASSFRVPLNNENETLECIEMIVTMVKRIISENAILCRCCFVQMVSRDSTWKSISLSLLCGVIFYLFQESVLGWIHRRKKLHEVVIDFNALQERNKSLTTQNPSLNKNTDSSFTARRRLIWQDRIKIKR